LYLVYTALPYFSREAVLLPLFSNAAQGNAAQLVVNVHKALATAKVQVPAVGESVLRAAPVEAVRASAVQLTSDELEAPGSVHF
jgi:hypothetical protein